MIRIRPRRVWGIVLRHLYNFYHNLDRLVDAFYWPTMDIIIWGLTISALQTRGDTFVTQIAMILSGVVLWYVLWRSQYEITVNLLEELWSENLVNLFSSPLTLAEWILGMFVLGIMKLFLTVSFTAIAAWIFHAVNVFDLGFYMIPFIVSLLIMGWAFGLFIAGLFLRSGTTIQTFAWAGGFLLMPFSATYYPLATLPQWVQNIAQFLPSAYIFEGMRSVLQFGTLPFDLLYKSFFLNAIYLALALWYFVASYAYARRKGLAHLK